MRELGGERGESIKSDSRAFLSTLDFSGDAGVKIEHKKANFVAQVLPGGFLLPHDLII